ncbi:hypothetical protein [Streptomyces sp. NPDC001980]
MSPAIARAGTVAQDEAATGWWGTADPPTEPTLKEPHDEVDRGLFTAPPV